jgi:hypothetical protein
MNAALIDQARAADILSVAQQCGAQLKRIGAAEWAGPCPACGGRDRFSVNTKRQLFNCRGAFGGDVIAMVSHLQAMTFLDAVAYLTGEVGAREPIRREPIRRAPPAPAAAAPQGEQRRIDRAAAIFGEGVGPCGTPLELYLNSRGLGLEEDVAGAVVRFHPRCPWRDEATDRTIYVPAMVAALRSITTDEITGVHRTRLSPNGQKIDRRMLGIAAGSAVKLDSDDSVNGGLHVAEGIESGLAARQLGLRPTWALGSAGAIAAFPVLAGVDALTILFEYDAGANNRAATECAERWIAAGKEVFIVSPTSGKDLNDALPARRA